MKMVMRPRYYCEFCKKGGGSPSHIKRHEAGCTIRPDRTCGMCNAKGFEKPQTALSTLIPLALAGDIDGLRTAANGCPACMLAAIRMAPWPEKTDAYDDGFNVHCHTYKVFPRPIEEWKFKDAVKEFWAVVNNELAENEDHYAYG